MKIGLVGLGRMGRAIYGRLSDNGCEVTAWDHDQGAMKAAAERQVRLADNPRAVAAAGDVVISIITEDHGVRNVFRGTDGFLSGDVKGKLFIEMSTVPPSVPVLLAEKVRAKGAALVECPVGGSTGPARQGKLLGLMGATPEDAARAKPILDQLCRRIEHAGPVGSGAVLKFTVNMPLMIYWQALGEALALCRSLNLEPERLMDMLSETSGAATVLKVRAGGIASMLKGGDGGPVTFNVDGAIKDLRAMLAEGKQQGVELPLVEKTLACYEEAQRNVSGDAEVSAVSVYWAQRAKS